MCLRPLLPLLLFLVLSPSPSPFVHYPHSATASPPGVSFDDISVEDYTVVEQEPTKPDDVDNEVIQSLVDNFLNKGSVGDRPRAGGAEGKAEAVPTEPPKLNKEAQALVNSSDYWRTDNLEPADSVSDPTRVQSWLAGYSAELQRVLQQIALSGWNYFTSASFTTKQYLDEAEEVGRAFLRASARQSRQFNASAFPHGTAERIQLSILAQQGMNALAEADLHEFNRILFSINRQFTHTQLCGEAGKLPIMGGDRTACLLKFSDLPSALNAPSADATLCVDLWQKWRLAAGQNLTQSYAQLVELSNKGAALNGFSDAGAMWRAVYELPEQFGFHAMRQLDIRAQLDVLHSQLSPLYQQLHAYFRSRLAAIHSRKGSGENQRAGLVSRDGPLPVHLLKSVNGDSWSAYYEQTRPFAEELPAEEQKIANEVLNTFHAQNYTVRVMFSKVYRFMKYLGFERLPRSFWTNSIFTRNWSRDMICNPATAYDMMNGDDYRIKVCGQLSEQDFVSAHRLMAKLHYQYASRNQPILLKDAPNPSLSAALAGAFGVIAQNTDYLRAQKLVGENVERVAPAEVNRLYKEALDEVVKLPFAVAADKWRYSVFEGRLAAANWSAEWWALRQRYQGVAPPENADPRAVDFDAVASPAISQTHAPATKDAIAYVVQFQILKKLCGGISQLSQGCLPNKAALESVHAALSRGGSISWLDAFEKLTGTRQLDAAPLLEYYEPLVEWLKNTNQIEQRVLGWANPKGDPFPENELPELKSEYENEQSFGSGLGFGGGGGESGGESAQIAFPGQSCANGQECLLESQCNGTVCVCREGLYTLHIADSYNCVPGDPAKVGFTDDNGGLVIALNPNNETMLGTTNSTADGAGDGMTPHEATHPAKEGMPPPVSRSQMLYAPIWIGVIVGLALVIP